MKTKIVSLMCILVMVVAFTACSNDDDNDVEQMIEAHELPQMAQDLISQNFPDAEYVYIKKEIDKGKIEYEVKLSNGFELDFDAEGNWTSVDGKGLQIPDAIIPEPILTYVQNEYPGTFIREMEKKMDGIEVELSTDVDLKFDQDGNFLYQS